MMGNGIPFLTLQMQPDAAMFEIAEDAWAQHVAKVIADRKDFQGLEGLDLLVFRQAQRKLSWKARCFLQLIQDGSFLDARSQSKFDVASVLQKFIGNINGLLHWTQPCPWP